MFPTLFTIPGLDHPVSSFGLMVVLGYLLGATAFGNVVTRYERDEERLARYASVPIWTLIGVLLGARLLYVIVEVLRGSETGQAFVADPLEVLRYWKGGLVMYGGAIGGVLGGLLCTRKPGLPVWHVLDIGAASAFLGLAVGRIGCLLVGDDYGSIVPADAARALPFPITIKVPDVLHRDSLFGQQNAGQVLWATQIWMSLNAFVLSWFGFRWIRSRRYAGHAALKMFVWYAIARATIEAFRGDEVRGVWFGGFSTSQLISAVVGVVCVGLLLRNRRLENPDPAPLEDEALDPAGA